jgi:hypothetical protein
VIHIGKDINTSDADIISSIQKQPEAEEKEADERKEDEEIIKHVNHSTASNCADTLLQYKNECDFEYNDIISIRKNTAGCSSQCVIY